ncbi:hypothetical protein ACJ41O_014438 [Fusarium nematophilum]
MHDAHTEPNYAAARASIAPPLHQPVECQYRGVDGISTIPPPYSKEQVGNFPDRRAKTTKELREFANRLLQSNWSQASRESGSRDHGFSAGIWSDRLRTGEGGNRRELFLTRSSMESQASTVDRQSPVDQRNSAPRERRRSLNPVRPAIRPPCGHRRSSSLPASPKAVHFGPVLEDVRYFNKSERPLAVSAGSSPVKDCVSSYFESPTQEPVPYEWEVSTPNFPRPTMTQTAMPVRLERVGLSNDKMALLGTVVVANLAYHKSIVCRFTLDFWNTISEVTAQHCHEIPGHDIFSFSIGLAELVDLELKPMFFCIRYNVDGQEFWDNNSSLNFQVDFKKRYLW